MPDPYPLSARDIAELRRIIRKVDSIGGDGVSNSRDSIRIKSIRQSRQHFPSDLWDWIRITNKEAGAGIYKARSQQPVTGADTLTVTTDFVATTFFKDVQSTDDIEFWNIAESAAAAGTHALPIDGSYFVLARRNTSVMSKGSPGKPVYEANVGTMGPRPATLSHDGGAAGTNGPPPTAATYTYTATPIGGGTAYGTTLAVWPARQLGHVTAATKGYIDTIGGTMYVVMHDEVLDTAACA